LTARSGDMSRPIGVTLLAILQLITGLSNVFSGLGALGASSTLGLTELQKNILFWLGVILFVLGLSSLWLARAYVIGHEWARHRGRTIAIVSILLALLVIVLHLPEKLGPDSPGLSIIWNMLVFYYLGRPKIVAYFAGRWTGKPWSSKPGSSKK
jgi:hypothetical protein